MKTQLRDLYTKYISIIPKSCSYIENVTAQVLNALNNYTKLATTTRIQTVWESRSRSIGNMSYNLRSNFSNAQHQVVHTKQINDKRIPSLPNMLVYTH